MLRKLDVFIVADFIDPDPFDPVLRALRAIQGSHSSGLALGACLGMKNIGKPCAGEPHARFDEGGQARACSLLYSLISQASIAQTP